jgi:hypothetical protein
MKFSGSLQNAKLTQTFHKESRFSGTKVCHSREACPRESGERGARIQACPKTLDARPEPQ